MWGTIKVWKGTFICPFFIVYIMVSEKLYNLIASLRAFFKSGNREKMPYLITATVSLLLFIIGINLFVELSSLVKGDLLGTFDESVFSEIHSYRTPLLNTYFIFVTDIGDIQGYAVILVICALVVIFTTKRWALLYEVTSVLLLATISNVLLKRAYDRARPDLEHLVTVKTLSYPSGHAMSSMAFYGFLIYLVYKSTLKVWMKTIIIAISFVLILSIGTSRVYLGVHFPSDVLGGWIAGLIWVVFCILIYNLIEIFRKDPLT